MKVVFSREAARDLEQIGDYIAQDSPRRAISFVEELYAAALALASAPQAYPFVARYERIGIRRRVHGDYLILYQVDLDRVWVHRILHGARDYGWLLFPEG